MREEQFYNLQPLAIFGVSTSGHGFGVSVYKELVKVGIPAYPINPKGGELKGQTIYRSLDELPEPARAAVILTKGANALEAVKACSSGGVKCVWLQGNADIEDVRRVCAEKGLEVVRGSCILLRRGRFPHSLHRFFHDLFKGKQKD